MKRTEMFSRPGWLALLLALAPATADAARTSTLTAFTDVYRAESAGENLSRGYLLSSVDGDLLPELGIGSPLNDAAGADSGRFYLFQNVDVGTGTVDVSSASLVLTGEASAQLGAAAASGDLNGDGKADLVIAAPGWSGGAGRVYLFFSRTSWAGVQLSAADLILSGDQAGQGLGAGGILIPGDLNGDGYADLVISSPGRDASSTARDRGAVYVLLGNSLGWSARTLATADVLLIGDGNGDNFGASLALAGDVNGDGKPDLVVGAPRNDDSATDAGQAYLYFGGALPLGENSAGPSASVRVRGDISGDQLGSGVSGGGDFNADGLPDVFLGAPGEDSNGLDAGRVYAINGRKRDWPLGPVVASAGSTLSFLGAATGDQLGSESSFTQADLSNDGIAELILAARGAAGAAGTAYIFLGRASGLGVANNVAAADVVLNGSTAGDRAAFFAGAALDVDGDKVPELALGIPGFDGQGTDSGEIRMASALNRWFDLDSDGFTPEEGDCDDREPSANPAQTTDDRDDIDNDCDGQVDEDASSGCGGRSMEPLVSHRGLAGVGLLSLLALGQLRRRRR